MTSPDDVYGTFSKFDAIKDYKYNPNPSNSEDLTKDQQRDIDRLEAKCGKIVVTKQKKEEDKVSLVEEASRTIMGWYNFVTIEETKEILYYKDGVYLTGGDIIIEKETEKICGFELSNSQISEIKGHIMRRTYQMKGILQLASRIYYFFMISQIFGGENSVYLSHLSQLVFLGKQSHSSITPNFTTSASTSSPSPQPHFTTPKP